MPGIPEAIDALRLALHNKGVQVESQLQDAFNHLASCLVLLNSSSPSVQMIQKLCTVLRQSPLPLYNACLQPALHLSSCILSTVLERLCDNVEDEKLRSALDDTAKIILSGILDFLDKEGGGDVGFDNAVWETLYRVICGFFFLDSTRGLPVLSVQLCLSAYNMLTETAAKHITLRNALHQKDILGGERLGVAVSRARDYLLLEALLILFARLLPPIHNTSQGKSRRLKFVKEVLGSPKLFKCSAELLDIMQKTSGTQWDDIAAQIIDALARNDVTCPQPFSIDEIDVCGHVFPQPLATDRLIMDKQVFLANVIVEDNDLCESLQVPYSHIRKITLDPSEKNVPKGKVLIMVYLASAPLVADVELKSSDEIFYAKFLLQNDDVGRFMEALRRRGVGKLSFLNPPAEVQRKRKSVSIGSGLKFVNDSSPVPSMASFEGKIQHVNQVYKTDIQECETVPLPHIEDVRLPPTPDLKPALKDEVLAPELIESALVEDVPVTLVAAKLISPTKEASKGMPPGNSIGAIPSYDNSDELSEISEFELEDDTVNERVATRKSTSSNHESKLKRCRKDRIRKNASSIAICATEITGSSEFASKTGANTKGVTRRSPQIGRSLLHSPVSGSLSSSRIDISPKEPLNANTTIGNEVFGGLSVASQDFAGLDALEEPENTRGTFGTELIAASAGSSRTRFGPTGDKFGQHPRHLIPTSGANQKVHSVHAITKDTSIPPKIAGNRRKRETVKSPAKVIIEVDDGSTPPRKKRKSRDQKLGIREDKAKHDELSLDPMAIFRTQRSTPPAKGSSPSTDPTMVDFEELPEPESTRHGIRRSSRIKKMQTTTAVGTRANAMRGKTQKSNQVDDPSVKIYDTPPMLLSHPELTENGESPSSKFRNDILTSAKKIHPETSLPRHVLKAGGILLCEPSQPNASPTKEPRGNLDLAQRASSDAVQPMQERFLIKTEETIDSRSSNSVLRTVDNNVDQVQKIGLSQPIKSAPRAESVTIDLTIDDSPVQSEQHEAPIVLVRPEADIQTRFGTPDQSDSIAIEAPVVRRSPRHRRRSVTFASPIEYVLDKKVKSQSQVGSFSPQHRQSPSPSENNILSPLRIPTGTVNRRRESPDQIVPQVPLQKLKISEALPIETSVCDRIADEVEMQDIVKVLDEIQAVIIKGISNRFRNVRKDVQRGRDELLREVLDELHDMVVENARYFNGLVHLEEDYYKNSNSITRCWEELIDCNDAIGAQFRKALMEHDQKISAKTFPKSLLHLKPVSLSYRANV